MNRIEKRKIQEDLKFNNTVVLKYKIEYPQITQSNYMLGKENFNRFNRYKAIELQRFIKNELYKEAVELYKYNSQNGYPIMQYEIILTYEITYNNQNIVSMYYDQYEFRGGAHGNTIRTSQTWDLRMGKKMELSQFYPNNPNYILDILKSINRQIKEQIANGNNVYFDDYCELVLENFKTKNYYLTEDGIIIYFQQYDIGPYSSGILEFNVSK